MKTRPIASLCRALAPTWIVLLGWGIGLPRAAPAQPVDLPVFGDSVDVQLINLEVVVTRRGQRVGGLGPEDFRLRVDGEEVAIEHFSEISGGRAVGAESSPGAPAALGESLGTRYLVFIDDDFTVPTVRNRVLRRLAEQTALLQPEDRMAVVAFDGRRLDLLTSWTRSLAQLETVFERARERRAYGLLRRSDRWRWTARSPVRSRAPYGSLAPGSATSFSATGFVGLERALTGTEAPEALRYGDSQGQVARVVRAAASAMRGFARPAGRKVLLMLAGDWPIYGDLTGTDSYVRSRAEQQLLEPLVATANRLGYTLYPIEARAETATAAVSVESGRRAVAGLRAALADESDGLGKDTLRYLARQTGGKAFLAGARFDALEGVFEDTRSYYWLGFTPRWKQDDGVRRVEVEVARPGHKARSRTSFSDLSRQTEVSMQVESAHLFDVPLAGSGELAVDLGTARPAGAGKIVLPIRLEIPFDRVTVLPNDGAFEATLELRIAATDSDGTRADLAVVPVRLESPGPPRDGQVARYTTRLRLRRKPHRLLISLYDPLSESFLARRVEFEP